MDPQQRSFRRRRHQRLRGIRLRAPNLSRARLHKHNIKKTDQNVILEGAGWREIRTLARFRGPRCRALCCGALAHLDHQHRVCGAREWDSIPGAERVPLRLKPGVRGRKARDADEFEAWHQTSITSHRIGFGCLLALDFNED